MASCSSPMLLSPAAKASFLERTAWYSLLGLTPAASHAMAESRMCNTPQWFPDRKYTMLRSAATRASTQWSPDSCANLKASDEMLTASFICPHSARATAFCDRASDARSSLRCARTGSALWINSRLFAIRPLQIRLLARRSCASASPHRSPRRLNLLMELSR